MHSPTILSHKPRKTPVQARSQVTVDAVLEATIQVLLVDGAQKLTTTRVAERAGVSVGTLYQYFPQKQALLFAVLARHLEHVANAVETTCERHKRKPLAVMVKALVHAFIDAKTLRVEESTALYRVAAVLNATELIAAISARSQKAVSAMLASATDVHFADLSTVTFVFLSAMVGPTRAVFEGNAPAKMERLLKGQLVLLCLGYLERVGTVCVDKDPKIDAA
jgi:AcrR family transcriptional regulator